MPSDVSPILDRHMQEHLGAIIRERLDGAHETFESSELDDLLERLRQADEAFADVPTIQS